MATESYMVCDHCGKKEITTAPTVWLRVTPIITAKYAATLDREEVIKLQDTADEGDFCSLLCIAEWAFARHNLKALDIELGGAAG